MTAQTNDPLNAFAYPQAQNNPVSAPSTSVDQTVPQPSVQPDPSVVTTPVVDPMQSVATPLPTTDSATRGNSIEGPAPVAPDPSLLNPTPNTDDSSSTQQVDPMASDPSNLSAAGADQLVEPEVKEEPKEEVEEEEEHDSPLKALAKKLSKLREEFVQETPDEEKKEEVKPEEPKLDQAAVSTMDAPLSDPGVKPADMSALQEVAPTSPSDIPIPQEVVETPSAVDPVMSTELPVPQEVVPTTIQPESQLQADVPLTNPLPEAPKTDMTSMPDLSSAPSIPTDDMSSANAPASQVDGLTPAPAVTPSSTLEQMFPEVVDKPMTEAVNNAPVSPVTEETPATLPTQNSSPSFVIDENDNSQVNPQNVEVASEGSKYPLNINKIMDIAIERNASDIQVSVGYPVMIRIDGTLVEVNEHVVSPTNAEELIMPVLTDQKKELLEVNREVDLAYSPLHNKDARFRINAYYSKGNLTAAFRLIPSKIRTIDELMLPPMYNQLIKLGQGLVLVTGPTGHGKSTTLAAMLQAINTSRAVHMLTIEDPIEYVFKPAKAVIDQREMHDDTHSWTVALKSALRQDPDVILVGEMRDYETIASTVTLAETGHLVFATLHTNSAAQTVDRIIDVFPENQQAQIRTQLANILEAVVAQRLIPIEGGGRRAVSEIMLGNPAVRNLIREGKTHQIDNVIRTSADIGMVSLEQSLVKLVREGLITMERAQEYAVHPEEVVRLLKS